MAYIVLDNVKWGDSPEIPFEFQYIGGRNNGKQEYGILVWCHPMAGTRYFGYPIYVEISLDGVQRHRYTLKEASPNRWDDIIKGFSCISCDNKFTGTTALKIRIYSGSGSTRDKSYSYTLPVDPAVSTISCTEAKIESNPTITITPASTKFTHSVSYKFGSLSGDIAIKTSATSITNWTIPEEFYKEIPNSKKGEGTLTCTTYNGGSVVGTSQCKLPVSVFDNLCYPSVSASVVDINPKTKDLTGDESVLIRYHSTAQTTVDVTLNKYAGSLKRVLVSDWNTSQVFTSSCVATWENVSTNEFYCTATDSRETTKVYEFAAKALVPYIKLTANVTGQRTDPTSGRATMTIKGNYYAGSFGQSDNWLTIKYRHGDGDYITATPKIDAEKNEYSTNVSLTGLTYTEAFDIEVVVEDALEQVTKTLTIPKGIPVFDWGEEDFNFNVPVTIQGVNILEKLAELEEMIAAKG